MAGENEVRSYREDRPQVEVWLPGGGEDVFRDHAALLDELRRVSLDVGTRQRLGAGGLDPGFYEPIFYVILAGAGVFATGFFGRAGQLAAEGVIGGGIAEAVGEHEGMYSVNEEDDNGVVPGAFLVGSVQFNLRAEPTQEELTELLLEAAAKVESLPPQAFSAETRLNLFWDADEKRWYKSPPKQ